MDHDGRFPHTKISPEKISPQPAHEVTASSTEFSESIESPPHPKRLQLDAVCLCPSPLPPSSQLPSPCPSTAAQLAPSPHPPSTGAAVVALDIEEEDVGDDESVFLDGVTHLAELESELKEVKKNLAKKNSGAYIPLKLFRLDDKISVTDVSAHLWCQAKLEYKYLHPHMKRTVLWRELADRGKPVQLRTEEMKQGTVVHLKKELEVHEPLEVDMVTKEDKWAVTLLATYTQLAAIKSGDIEREITVFGAPFSQGLMIHGVIDQLQYLPSTGEFILLDYKTRYHKSMPSFTQKKGNALQLMLYKCLLDQLTSGCTSFEILHLCLRLDFSCPISPGPVKHIEQIGLGSLFGLVPGNNDDSRTITFGEVAERVAKLIQGLELPPVSSLMLQYEHQSTGEVIGVDQDIVYREDWVREQVESSLEYWLGKETVVGVEVEDAWKCRSCQFRDVCIWKKRRELEKLPAANVRVETRSYS